MCKVRGVTSHILTKKTPKPISKLNQFVLMHKLKGFTQRHAKVSWFAVEINARKYKKMDSTQLLYPNLVIAVKQIKHIRARKTGCPRSNVVWH